MALYLNPTKCGRLCRHWRAVDVRSAGCRQKVVASGAELGFMNFGYHFFKERNLGTFWIQSFTHGLRRDLPTGSSEGSALRCGISSPMNSRPCCPFGAAGYHCLLRDGSRWPG